MPGANFHALMLGPQRFSPTVGDINRALEARGRVAIVTAGWQEREAEDEELRAALELPALNLRLHARAEQVFAAHPELFAAYRQRQDSLRQLQHLYRRRLRHAMDAVRELFALLPRPPLEMPVPRLQQEVSSALLAVRQLDERHMKQVAEIWQGHTEALEGQVFGELVAHRGQLLEEVEGCEVVAIAGGHVASLLNRLRIFGLANSFRGRHLLCWSAGAMVLSERIVLFHDCPPQGRGDAEILGAGLGLLPGVLALPHAGRRLLLDDPTRVGRFAQRFAPYRCVALDPGSEVRFTDTGEGQWAFTDLQAACLQEDGICN